ncbi:MAG: Ricin-type beta-trefoil lectin domain [Panacagrimonas sp.]|jgi:hypothetical protein|nr:ricin-type beta-trefoil lectin domain protein [Panacagrimonas sp.]MCC2656214.1 Ricin-type beta-trefoil lectin domain [Panacagrimonas sp.]
MRRLNAAVAAGVCWLALFPAVAWSQSGLFQGETKIIIHDDEVPPPKTDASEKPATAATAPRAGQQAVTASPPSRSAAPAQPTASDSAMPRISVYSPSTRTCIEADHQNSGSTAVMSADCTGPSRQWISDKGRLMTAWKRDEGSHCIRRQSQKSDRVQLVSCRAGDAPAADQMWLMRGAQIVGVDGRCLQADGRGVRVGACDSQNALQMWVAQPLP